MTRALIFFLIAPLLGALALTRRAPFQVLHLWYSLILVARFSA